MYSRGVQISPRTCSLVAQRAFGRYTRKKKLSKLPKLPDSAQWHFIWGLNAKAIEGHEIVADQPILQLTAVSTPDLYAQNRHALCECLGGFVPGKGYRVTL